MLSPLVMFSGDLAIKKTILLKPKAQGSRIVLREKENLMDAQAPSQLTLKQLVHDLARGLKLADAATVRAKNWKPGIGPFDEKPALKLAIQQLIAAGVEAYKDVQFEVPYPGEITRERCDLVISQIWAVEVKQIRPFGDNGVESRDWVKNALYPYLGHEGLLGDCEKLKESRFPTRKAVVAFGFEHASPQLRLDVAIEAFEILASHLHWIDFRLGGRETASEPDLIHPVHKQLRVYGWEVF